MERILQYAITVLLLVSCSTNSKVKHESDMAFHRDVPFIQEYHEGFVIDEDIRASNDVRAILPDNDDNIWIATRHGVFMKKPGHRAWHLMIEGERRGPAYDVKMDDHGKIWVACWDGVYTNAGGKLGKSAGPKAPVARIVTAKEGIYALGPKGIWLRQGNSWEKKHYTKARSIRAAISDRNRGLWIGTDVGLYHCSDERSIVYNKNEDLISAYVKGLDYDGSGNLWAGGLGGVSIRNDKAKVGEKRPKDGITSSEVNVVTKSPDGTMWVGTNYGITRFTPGKEAYSVRLSRRWLMSDEVRDIGFDKKGNAWIATANGVSAIKKREMTLAQKADYYYKLLIQRHVRDPWIVGRFRLAIPGDTTTIEPDDDDNDGEYTAMYLAMESLRYAVTKSPEAKERAEKAFDFLHYLREVTEIDGFFARTIVPVSWNRTHDMNRTYTPRELADELVNNPRHKPVEIRWHVSKDGKWKWKGDTSSDELCGHLFGYYWYYNLVADDLEKKRVANHFCKIVDHLIRNDFCLTGVDGKPTKWGVWSPKSLNEDPEWSPEKALNSLEILSFLKFAYKISGDEKYEKAYLMLIQDEGYIRNAKLLHHTNPAWETYFDIYLALYVYPPLIRYEQNAAIKSEFRAHLDEWFLKYKETKSPLVNFTYNYLGGGNDGLDHSIFFLQDAPLDLVDWQFDNGRREDLHVVREPILETRQVDELRPPSEYRKIRWDRNPYAAIAGNPAQERDPVYWLLPYWMGRYLELIR
ncbi:MAG: regulator [Cytophagales bacterium]|nr:regulator [Cytophagales bacterium]